MESYQNTSLELYYYNNILGAYTKTQSNIRLGEVGNPQGAPMIQR